MFSLVKKVAGKAKEVINDVSLKVMLAVGAVMVGMSASAQEAVTLPSTGVDVGAYATAGITTLGGIVAICVGGVIAFMLVKWGIKWVRGIGR